MMIIQKLVAIMNRKFMVVFLLFISFIATSGSFAFFSDYTNGTSTTTTTTFSIGYSLNGDVSLPVTHDYSATGVVVPLSTMLNSNPVYEVTFTLTWDPSSVTTDGWGFASAYTFDLSTMFEVYYLNKYQDSTSSITIRIMDLLTIAPSATNPTTVNVEDGIATYTYTISLPSRISRNDEVMLNKSDVIIYFEFTLVNA